MGKGDKPRPLSVSEEEFERRWERTFGSDPDINPAEIDECEGLYDQEALDRANDPEMGR